MCLVLGTLRTIDFNNYNQKTQIWLKYYSILKDLNHLGVKSIDHFSFSNLVIQRTLKPPTRHLLPQISVVP